jgi:hypothetical protein
VAEEKVPGAHKKHLDAQTPGINVPIGHRGHTVLPALFAKLPAAHTVQTPDVAAPLLAEKVPVGQFRQLLSALDARLVLYLPSTHDRHVPEFEAARVAEYLPAGQAWQLLELLAPVVDENVPAAQD